MGGSIFKVRWQAVPWNGTLVHKWISEYVFAVIWRNEFTLFNSGWAGQLIPLWHYFCTSTPFTGLLLPKHTFYRITFAQAHLLQDYFCPSTPFTGLLFPQIYPLWSNFSSNTGQLGSCNLTCLFTKWPHFQTCPFSQHMVDIYKIFGPITFRYYFDIW